MSAGRLLGWAIGPPFLRCLPCSLWQPPGARTTTIHRVLSCHTDGCPQPQSHTADTLGLRLRLYAPRPTAPGSLAPRLALPAQSVASGLGHQPRHTVVRGWAQAVSPKNLIQFNSGQRARVAHKSRVPKGAAEPGPRVSCAPLHLRSRWVCHLSTQWRTCPGRPEDVVHQPLEGGRRIAEFHG